MESTLTWLEPVCLPQTSPRQQITVGTPSPVFSTPHQEELLALKNEIDTIAPIQLWDDAKKITNPYEFVFLSLQKRMHRSIAAITPLSRSYFKMIELWQDLQLDRLPAFHPAFAEQPFLTAHSAEGPGGFLEAIQHRVTVLRTHPATRMIAMTLRSTERSVPGWRKSQAFLTAYPSVLVTYGSDGTGNLYSLANQDAYQREAIAHLGGRAHLYTADGGFDFSADFNAQENTVQRLLAAEALCGIRALRVGGVMILKIFDTKLLSTLELLWILAGCFERTALIKPHTSRPANSERYWIGFGLRESIPDWVLPLLSTLTARDAPAGWSQIFSTQVTGPWTQTWLTELRQFQERIEQQQLNNIQMTLNLIKQQAASQIDLTRVFLATNIEQSRAWCAHYGITDQHAGQSTEALVLQNLEEALAPFQASGAHTSSLALSRQPPTHRVSISRPVPPPPAAPAWRSALPASVRDPGPLRAAGETPPSIVPRVPHATPLSDLL